MDLKKPRRKGTIEEFQNGRWFLYRIKWEETVSDDGKPVRAHEELEIYYNKSEVVLVSGDPDWYSTDIKEFDCALKMFSENPEKFRALKQ